MIRAMAQDGGGNKGSVGLPIEEALEAEVGPLHEHFDLIGGTSVGAIKAVWYGTGGSAAELRTLFRRWSPEIFAAPWWWQVRYLGGKLGPKYPLTGLRRALESVGLHRIPLSECRTRVLVTTYAMAVDTHHHGLLAWAPAIPAVFLDAGGDQVEYHLRGRPAYVRQPDRTAGPGKAVVLKSWEPQAAGWTCAEAAMASAAAPTFFEALVKDDRAWWDGGVYASNPGLCVDSETRRLWPDLTVHQRRLLSIGTSYPHREIPMDTTDPKDLDDLEAFGRELAPGVLEHWLRIAG